MARHRLKEEFASIPLTDADREAAKVPHSWPSNRLRLRRDVSRRDPRGFLTWGVIRDTMFPPPHAAFARAELKYLQQHNWTFWREVVKERATGLPLPCLFYAGSSTNAIHHAYHLCRFEVETGVGIRDLETIFEFGGGYGSLCRIAFGAGFSGRYVIFDLPEQSALQRYYLNAIGVRDVQTVSGIEQFSILAKTRRGPSLFIATWSLSESPLELRQRMAELVNGFDAFLIAYQSEFAGMDNVKFFRDWQTWFADVIWRSLTIQHVPASKYLFGTRILHTGQ